MKIIERTVVGLIRQVVSIDDCQFGFVLFVVRQLQEKYLAVNKGLYMALVGLEIAFGHVPQNIIWRQLRKLGFSQEFEVKVGVHQGSVLNPLLFIIVLEALSREFRTGVP